MLAPTRRQQVPARLPGCRLFPERRGTGVGTIINPECELLHPLGLGEGRRKCAGGGGTLSDSLALGCLDAIQSGPFPGREDFQASLVGEKGSSFPNLTASQRSLGVCVCSDSVSCLLPFLPHTALKSFPPNIYFPSLSVWPRLQKAQLVPTEASGRGSQEDTPACPGPGDRWLLKMLIS